MPTGAAAAQAADVIGGIRSLHPLVRRCGCWEKSIEHGLRKEPRAIGACRLLPGLCRRAEATARAATAQDGWPRQSADERGRSSRCRNVVVSLALRGRNELERDEESRKPDKGSFGC